PQEEVGPVPERGEVAFLVTGLGIEMERLVELACADVEAAAVDRGVRDVERGVGPRPHVAREIAGRPEEGDRLLRSAEIVREVARGARRARRETRFGDASEERLRLREPARGRVVAVGPLVELGEEENGLDAHVRWDLRSAGREAREDATRVAAAVEVDEER